MSGKTDLAKVKFIRKIVSKWRKILHLDPIWTISIELIDADVMGGAFARVDTSNSEYYVALMEINAAIFVSEEEEFEFLINEIVCHELVHLVMIDFVHSAQVAAGDNESMHAELTYKYEQFTSRLQKAFMGLDDQIASLHGEVTKIGQEPALVSGNKEKTE